MATKRTITKLWLWGAAIMGVGGMVILASSLSMVAHVSNVTHDNRIKFTPDDFFWVTIFFIVLGSVIAGGGLITQLVAHRGAEVNTRRLADKAWFRKLRRGGIVSSLIALVTFVGMFAGGATHWRGTGFVVWIGFPLAVVIEWSVMLSYLVGGSDGSAAAGPESTAIQQSETEESARELAPTA